MRIHFYILGLLAVLLAGCSPAPPEVGGEGAEAAQVPAGLGDDAVEETVVVETPEESPEIIAPDAQPQAKQFTMTARQWEFDPEVIRVNKGDTVRLLVKSIDVAHGFALPDFGVNERLSPGQTVEVEFVADKAGTFTFFCSVQCGAGHSSMNGQLIVE